MRHKKRYVAVYSPKIANLMIKKGYTVHHTARNVINPYIKIYYFTFVPGILNVMERLKWEVQNAER